MPLESGVPAALIWVTIGTLTPPIPPGFGVDSPPWWPEIGTSIPLEVDLSVPPLIWIGRLVSLEIGVLDAAGTGTVLVKNLAGPPITAIATLTPLEEIWVQLVQLRVWVEPIRLFSGLWLWLPSWI